MNTFAMLIICIIIIIFLIVLYFYKSDKHEFDLEFYEHVRELERYYYHSDIGRLRVIIRRTYEQFNGFKK